MSDKLKVVVIISSVILFLFFDRNDMAAVSGEISGIGIEEKLGQQVPSDLKFHNEAGDLVSLKQLIDKPTIILPVYYSCPNVCALLLSGLAQALDSMETIPGKDYRALSISFDENDGPEIALDKKRNYMASFKNIFPEDKWLFLTGDSANIKAFTDSIGFRFEKRGNGFIHPSALVVLSPEGKIIRYLYGETYPPFDLKMAVLEASEGRVGPTITKVLKYCFSYDPEGKKYVFNILRVSATLILLSAAIFIIYLVMTKGTHKKVG